ncbi:hypothetical protein ACIPYS_13655 [Kitasatospora sp. NPDC089913]|uniref:hypothetical protein n=1 Tax=Kitasatospora sp. NPDC089913 TaxID=3364080 RepID=UPI0038050B98
MVRFGDDYLRIMNGLDENHIELGPAAPEYVRYQLQRPEQEVGRADFLPPRSRSRHGGPVPLPGGNAAARFTARRGDAARPRRERPEAVPWLWLWL